MGDDSMEGRDFLHVRTSSGHGAFILPDCCPRHDCRKYSIASDLDVVLTAYIEKFFDDNREVIARHYDSPHRDSNAWKGTGKCLFKILVDDERL